jgi:hypothetical protein
MLNQRAAGGFNVFYRAKGKHMGFEVSGIFGLILLVADIWAIVSTFQSTATTGKKVFWIVLILLLPLIGFIVWLIAGPKSGRTS